MADYFGPPKLDFGGLDPIGSFQKGQKFGLENRARGELAKCAPDDFGCMSKVLMSLDPEMGVRAAQVQGQLQHQKLIEGQGERRLKLAEDESIAEAAARKENLGYEARRVAATEAGTKSLEDQRLANLEEKQRDDETKVGAVVDTLIPFATARNDINAGKGVDDATYSALFNTAEAIAIVLGKPKPAEWAERNVPRGGVSSFFQGTEARKKIIKNLEAQLPAVAQTSRALKTRFTDEDFKVAPYVSPEDQAATDRNPPTESGGARVPPKPQWAIDRQISDELWAASPKLWGW